ncbi:hypothetical protein PLANPX_4270 [Lacipirellula parvula]|uniref:Uncharacterized protein n=1 Tax=Lacipirellula parvula TaxID=2650471 RepID=A0A5K7XDU5_9BACT|nr:hypothetical protein PLANPX_4270 [Lacipirellula parvula]
MLLRQTKTGAQFGSLDWIRFVRQFQFHAFLTSLSARLLEPLI